jgi:hypothetical protein
MAISLECNVRSLYPARNNDNNKPFPFTSLLSFRIQLPVLVNEWMRQSYAFPDDDHADLPSLMVHTYGANHTIVKNLNVFFLVDGLSAFLDSLKRLS